MAVRNESGKGQIMQSPKCYAEACLKYENNFLYTFITLSIKEKIIFRKHRKSAYRRKLYLLLLDLVKKNYVWFLLSNCIIEKYVAFQPILKREQKDKEPPQVGGIVLKEK